MVAVLMGKVASWALRALAWVLHRVARVFRPEGSSSMCLLFGIGLLSLAASGLTLVSCRGEGTRGKQKIVLGDWSLELPDGLACLWAVGKRRGHTAKDLALGFGLACEMTGTGQAFADEVSVYVLHFLGPILEREEAVGTCREDSDKKRGRLERWFQELPQGMSFHGCRYDGGSVRGFSVDARFVGECEVLVLRFDGVRRSPEAWNEVRGILLSVKKDNMPLLNAQLFNQGKEERRGK